MPIEIRELVVKLAVKDSHGVAGKQQTPSFDPGMEKRIVEQCVDRVLREIASRKER